MNGILDKYRKRVKIEMEGAAVEKFYNYFEMLITVEVLINAGL